MRSRSLLKSLGLLAVGLTLGWLATSRPTLLAQGGSSIRDGGSSVTSGPVSVTFERGPTRTNVAVTHDAIYYLDYAGGRVLAATPAHRQTGQRIKVIGAFAVRDLVADFRPPRGATPQFLMTVGDLGIGAAAGWAPLYIFETTTGQVAAYRVTPGYNSPTKEEPPAFELIELKRLP